MKFPVDRVTALAGLVVCSSAFPEYKLTVNNHKLLISSQVTNCLLSSHTFPATIYYRGYFLLCGTSNISQFQLLCSKLHTVLLSAIYPLINDFQSKLLRHGQSILDKMPLIMSPYKVGGLFSNSIYATNDRNHSFL